MKKIFLCITLLTFAFSTAKGETTVVNKKVQFTNKTVSVNAFCKLIQMGEYDAVKALVEQGENVNSKSTGLTPLMFAARHNKARIAQLLIDYGAKLKVKSDRRGLTALKLAELSNAKDSYEVIKIALDAQKNKKRNKKALIV
jgi:ankyrin repeat protein